MSRMLGSIIEHEAPPSPRSRRFLGIAIAAAAIGASTFVLSTVMSVEAQAQWDGWRPGAPGAGTVLADAIPIGRETDGLLYACRAMRGHDMHVGRLRKDFGGCHIGFDGRETEVTPFEVLAVSWRADDLAATNALVAGIERVANSETPFATLSLYVCHASYLGAVHSGQARSGEQGCSFGFGGKRIVSTTYELLQSSLWLNWVSATTRTIPRDAVVTGMEGAEAFYACRAADKNGLHPGKVKRGPIGCSIVSEGREVTSDRFEVLAPHWSGGHAGTTPVGAYLAGRENGEGQFLCRAQSGNSVQIGKVSDALGGCHVGMQGREVVLLEYDVLTQ